MAKQSSELNEVEVKMLDIERKKKIRNKKQWTNFKKLKQINYVK